MAAGSAAKAAAKPLIAWRKTWCGGADNWQQWPGQTRGGGDGALVSRSLGDEVERRRAVGWHVTFRVGTRAVQSNLTSFFYYYKLRIPSSLLRRVCYDSETHANADPDDASSSPHLGCSPCMELFASLAPWPWGAVLSLLRLIAYTALFELASHRETAASPPPTPKSESEHCQIHSGVPTFGCRADMSATLCLVTPHQFDLLRDAAASCHRMIVSHFSVDAQCSFRARSIGATPAGN